MNDGRIHLFTDGGNIGNGQPESLGAWAYVLHHRGKQFECSGIVEKATNNICEMTALLMGLRKIKNNRLPLVVYSDSKYLINGLDLWIPKWMRNNWKTSDGNPVKNKDLWIELNTVKQSFYDISFVWVKGHSGNEWNQRCDDLCRLTRDQFLREYLNEFQDVDESHVGKRTRIPKTNQDYLAGEPE